MAEMDGLNDHVNQSWRFCLSMFAKMSAHCHQRVLGMYGLAAKVNARATATCTMYERIRADCGPAGMRREPCADADRKLESTDRVS